MITSYRNRHSSRPGTSLLALCVSAALCYLPLGGKHAQAAESHVALSANVVSPLALKQAHLLGLRSSAASVRVSIVLSYRNKAVLSDMLKRVYDSKDPLYHKFLTGADFNSRFAPTEADYEAVANFAQSNGLKIVQRRSGRTLLTVEGTGTAIESAFGVRLANYKMPDGRVAYANLAAPRIPVSMAGKIMGVIGLNNLTLRKPHIVKRPSTLLNANSLVKKHDGGSGPTGGFTPQDIKTAYSLSNLTIGGEGQVLALYELDGYLTSDITTYTTRFGLPTAPLQNVLVDGFDGSAGDGAGEVVLDIDMMMALAPKISKIYVYEAENGTTGIVDAYSQIADDFDTTHATSVSTSWGIYETANPGDRDTENQIFQKMALQGQSIYAAAGDSGAYDDGATISVDDPASQPYMTGVGGTKLSTNGAGGTYASETAWADPTDTRRSPFGFGGGGGSSVVWAKPSWQTGLGSSSTMRDVPDVSLNADLNTGYDIYVGADGGWGTVGGTSAAAPLWAAFTALVNEQRVANGLTSPLGFANPSIYAIGKGTAYATNFHDIADNSTNLFYHAVTGYDDATGWGTFVGSNLLASLSGSAAGNGTGTLNGTVTDATNAPIQGVTITVVLANSGIPEGTVTTGADGKYTLTVPAGISLVVSADADGFAGRSMTGIIADKTTPTTVDFKLLSRGHVFAAGVPLMVSVPFDYTGINDFRSLFGLTTVSSNDPKLYSWEAYLNSYITTPLFPSDTFHLGYGYWVKFPATGTTWYLHREGTPALASQPYSVPLQHGWNLIGPPFDAAVIISDLKAAAINSGTQVPIASSSLVRLPLYTYNGTAYTTLTTTDTLNPYVGYWIYANDAATLTFPTPPQPIQQ